MESIEEYLASLASGAPVPGGGSAATLVAATGAAVVGMVARICAGNPKYAAGAALTARLAAESDRLRTELSAARERDERAFAAVVAAQALPKAAPEEKASRERALEDALRAAAREPLEAAALALAVVRCAEQLLEIPNRNLASDVGCAAEFGFAALAACAYNVRVNHRYMRDPASIEAQAAQLDGYEREGAATLARVRAAVAQLLAPARA